MRYLLDTNIFVYLAIDVDSLSKDVVKIVGDPSNLLYLSAESVRELIVGYRAKGLCSKRWKSPEEMVAAIENEFYIKILPLKKEHMETYARMELNEAQGHKDPSDHVIIAHALTERMALVSSDTRFDFYRKQGLDLVFNEKWLTGNDMEQNHSLQPVKAEEPKQEKKVNKTWEAIQRFKGSLIVNDPKFLV